MDVAGKALAMALVWLLAGCIGATTLDARHDPLYRAEAHRSTITAEAENRDGIALIRIKVIEGEMIVCGVPASVLPCRSGATERTHSCSFANPSNAACSFSFDLGDRRLVTYDVEVTSGRGLVTRSLPITYAAGKPAGGITLGPVQLPWDLAKPIWWNTGDPDSPDLRYTLDVGFFPDPDWSGHREFTDTLGRLIRTAHFNVQDRPFARLYTKMRAEGVFNLWVGPNGADAAKNCYRTWGVNVGTVAAVTDGDIIVHKNQFRDCAQVMVNGAGSVQGTKPDAALVYVHESGHLLFGLGDEYCCIPTYSSVSDPPNVFPAKPACTDSASHEGFSVDFCKQIGPSPFWRIDDGNLSIMDDDSTDADWRTASALAVDRRRWRCSQGEC